MNKLYLRMLREIKNNLGQFISIVLIIAIGSFVFSGMLTTIQSIKKGVNDYYEDNSLADAWIMFQSISEEELRDIPVGQDVQIEGRYTANIETVVNEHEVSLLFHSLTDINAVHLLEGRMPNETYECIIDSKFANANELNLGDTINPNLVENNSSLSIVGIGNSPENAFKVKDSATTHISQKNYGIIYTTKDTMLHLLKNSKEFTDQKANLMAQKNDIKRQASIAELEHSVEAYQEVLIKSEQIDDTIQILAKQNKYLSSIKQEDHASVAAVRGGIDTISTVSYLFPVVFFLVAAIILLITMTKMVENQRTQIAILQAMGISKGNIRGSYLFYATTASFFGSFLFAYLGTKTIPQVLMKMFYNRFSLGNMVILHSYLLLFAPFILALFCSLTAALLAVRDVLREVPAQAMRPKPPKKSKTIQIERIPWIWKRLSYSTKLICRNIFLNKLRIVLSSIGIIGSVMLMITGLSLRVSADEIIKARERGIIYDLSIVYNKPIEDTEALFSDTDISTIELTKTYHAELKENLNSSVAVQILPVGSQLVKLFDKAGDIIPIKEKSAIIPQTLADDANLKIGDSMTLDINDETDIFTVSDISIQYTSNIIYISELEAEKAELPLDYNTAMVKLTDTTVLNSLQQRLLAQSDVKAVNTREDINSAAKENLEILNAIIILIIVAAGIMTITVIYNITTINVFERAREFATLMVLGYYKQEVGRLLFVENMVFTVLGCIGGFPCGIILFKLTISSFSSTGVILPTKISIVTILAVYSITLIITIMTNLLMKKKLRAINMIEALKSVE